MDVHTIACNKKKPNPNSIMKKHKKEKKEKIVSFDVANLMPYNYRKLNLNN